jgi:hypothetical protein
MPRIFGGICIAVVMASLSQASQTSPAPAPAQSEAQFIVLSIASDLAEQVYYAQNHRLPDKGRVDVVVVERADSAKETPSFVLHVNLGGAIGEVNTEVNVTESIWSPSIYAPAAKAIAKAVGLRSPKSAPVKDFGVPEALAKDSAAAIAEVDEMLSPALQGDFCNPELHEQAALLLAGFAFHERAGMFYEARLPLCRITAHLTMAELMRGSSSFGTKGRLALAMAHTVTGAEVPALAILSALGTNDVRLLPAIRAAQACLTMDNRPLAQVSKRSMLEDVALFMMKSKMIDVHHAWEDLDEDQRQYVQFVRAANAERAPVAMGHQLSQNAVPLEMREIQTVMKRLHRTAARKQDFAALLNELPEHCFSKTTNATFEVRIIGWGQWAYFLQRHLCNAIAQTYDFLKNSLGVPEEAKEFSQQCQRQYASLRLYPFVYRVTAWNEEIFLLSMDQAPQVLAAYPQLVPTRCWNRLYSAERYAPQFTQETANRRVDWYKNTPLPGTLYELEARLFAVNISSQPGLDAFFEKLHELAPHDLVATDLLIRRRYPNSPTYEQAKAMYGPMLDSSLPAIRRLAIIAQSSPDNYEQLMLQGAKLNPVCYYELSDYFKRRNDEEKAMQYLDRACDSDLDVVRASNSSAVRVLYYLSKGDKEKAAQIADAASEVYSCQGLEAKAIYLEKTTNMTEAFEWYGRIEERYNHSEPLVYFCIRFKTIAGDRRYDEEVKKRLPTLFPQGTEKVLLAELHGAPTDGVSFKQDSELLTSAGMKSKDVIVGINGQRVHNSWQFAYLRDSQSRTNMDLIVWQGDSYHEIKASPPRGQFGVGLVDYRDY